MERDNAGVSSLYNVPMSASRSSLFRLTRRQWTALIGTPLLAQVTSTKPPVGSPAPPQAPSTPEERMAKANSDVRHVSDQLAQIEVPMNVEPAFSFRA